MIYVINTESNFRLTFYIKYGKRFFDIFSSLLGLICVLPLFLIIGILIKMDSPGPVFFCQTRIGKNFCKFKLYKFRTMVQNASLKGPSVTKGGDPRITKIGKFLRKYKIDELPQLLNVLKGDMSLVGPRPEVEKYVQFYVKEYTEILKVRPGITDYAALAFRDEEDILKAYSDPEKGYVHEILPKKIELYKKYLKNISFFTDLEIIVKTFFKILK